MQAVDAALAGAGPSPRHLELEITESTAMSRAQRTIGVLHDLNRLGVKLAIDDFGTGYSSPAYLNRFPLHSLKIDRSFVDNFEKDPHSMAIITATVSLAHSLSLKVVGEGIETKDQRDFLSRAGCDYAQGYFYSHPLPAEEFERLLKRTRTIRDEWGPASIAGQSPAASVAGRKTPGYDSCLRPGGRK